MNEQKSTKGVRGALYVVATPIGNLEDITLRALRVLKETDIILCEDTRVTSKLLNHYDIHTPLERLDAATERKKTEKVIQMLTEGKHLALVSDAGTPGVSDPGAQLIGAIRKQLSEIEIVAIPGASALTAALSISGLPITDFLFLGFLPHKKGREKLFKKIAESTHPVILYESPHRIEKTLASLIQHLAPSRRIVIARELTKLHEETISGTTAQIQAYFKENPKKIRGEFVVLVSAL